MRWHFLLKTKENDFLVTLAFLERMNTAIAAINSHANYEMSIKKIGIEARIANHIQSSNKISW